MSDNVTVDNGALTDYVVSSDEGAGGQVQRVKLAYSADGSETHVAADVDGLLVNLGTNNDVVISDGGNSITVDGTVTATVGTVTAVTTVGTITNPVAVTDNAGSLTVDNGGTFAVQATLAAGATAIAKAEDVASADADVGVPAMAVRKATPANTSGTDGDYEFLQMSAGRLWASATIDAALPAGTNAIGKLAANSGVDIGDVDVTSSVGPVASTATLANVSGSASSVTLIASNTARKGAVIVNDSTAILYIKWGSSASATSYTTVLPGSGSVLVPAVYELPGPTIYTGIITGIWASATGAARTTELT